MARRDIRGSTSHGFIFKNISNREGDQRLMAHMRKLLLPSSAFRNIILIFLLLIVPFYLMSLAAYMRGSQEVKEGVIKSNHAEIANTLAILENEVSHIRNLQTDLIQDENLTELVYFYEGKKNYDLMILIRGLIERLKDIQSASLYVKNASVYIFGSGVKISSRDSISDISESDRLAIAGTWESRYTQLAAIQGGLYMGLFYPFYNVETQYGEFSIMIEFDTEVLGRFINKSYNGRSALKFGDMFVGDESDEAVLVMNEAQAAGAQGSMTLKRAGESYIVAYRYSQALGAMMASFTTETSAFQGLEFYRRWLMAFIVIVILVILMFSYILYVIVHRPLKKLCDAFGEIAGGRLDISIEHKASDEFQYIYRQFNDTVQTINRLIRQTYEQKILAQEAELKQLQSKINPHFLYNTFFSISTMAKAEGGDMTFELASKTGKYFRYVMKSGSERVTLENELEYARLYAEIQQIRFSSRLDIIIDPPPSTDALLPAFCIQPLIENAIEHGLAQKACGGVIHVGFLEKPDGLAIFVEDNGGGVTEESISRITGTLAKSDEALSNISRRLEICFGRPDCLRLFVGKENGLRVEVFIPKK